MCGSVHRFRTSNRLDLSVLSAFFKSFIEVWNFFFIRNFIFLVILFVISIVIILGLFRWLSGLSLKSLSFLLLFVLPPVELAPQDHNRLNPMLFYYCVFHACVRWLWSMSRFCVSRFRCQVHLATLNRISPWFTAVELINHLSFFLSAFACSLGNPLNKQMVASFTRQTFKAVCSNWSLTRPRFDRPSDLTTPIDLCPEPRQGYTTIWVVAVCRSFALPFWSAPLVETMF